MSVELTDAEHLKFLLLSGGLAIADSALAHITAANGDRPLTPADYASTSGVILELDDDVWVNAPIATHNSNFVDGPGIVLDAGDGGLQVRGHGLHSRARFWLPPAYLGTNNAEGEPYDGYAFTHGDRVRISPVEGCSMACQFCDLPYDFKYRTKRTAGLVDSVRRALTDEVQPASHVLISGGTPKGEDIGYVREVYEATLRGFPGTPVDIMMVPDEDLLDLDHLEALGVNEVSVNIEIYNQEISRRLMRRKHEQGRDHYLEFLARAAERLGGFRARSMLMVGLEDEEDTLRGVRAIAERGAVPVLSPFRPDPGTPLRDRRPPGADLLERVFLRALEICDALGVPLGPSCVPCSHNTVTLPRLGPQGYHHAFGEVTLV